MSTGQVKSRKYEYDFRPGVVMASTPQGGRVGVIQLGFGKTYQD